MEETKDINTEAAEENKTAEKKKKNSKQSEIDSLKTQVPVIASYGDYAASGGYWISANCDYIYADETTLTGSIGVFSMIPDLQKTLNDKLHVNITAVNSNKHADMYGMMRPLDRQEKDMMQGIIENIYDKFTFVEIPEDIAEKVLGAMHKNTIRGYKINVEPARVRK